MKTDSGTPTGTELIEPSSPEALLPDIGLWPWWLGTTILIITLVMLIYLIRRKPSAEKSAESIRNAAFEEALAALGQTPAEHPRQAAIQASLILRKYLSTAAGDPALFETHEEFISRHDSLQALSPEVRAVTTTEFAHLAAIKYSPDIPAVDPSGVIADSKSLLETLHRGFAA